MSLKNRFRVSFGTARLFVSKYTFNPFYKFKGNEPVVLFLADGSIIQGGLVDRLKGIISTYYLAKHANKKFELHFSSPFELSDFLLPATVNWRPQHPIKFVFPASRPLYSIDSANAEVLEKAISNLKSGNRLDVFFNQDIFKGKENRVALWQQTFNELFTVSPRLEKEINTFPLPHNSLALHIRFLNRFGDYSNLYPENSPHLNHVLLGHELELFKLKVENAIKAIQQKNPSKKVILFCDSNYFIKNLTASLEKSLIIIPGDIKHSEDKEISGFDAHKKTFIDFFLMSRCEKVIMLKSKETYNSSFSEYAAIVGGKPFEVLRID